MLFYAGKMTSRLGSNIAYARGIIEELDVGDDFITEDNIYIKMSGERTITISKIIYIPTKDPIDELKKQVQKYKREGTTLVRDIDNFKDIKERELLLVFNDGHVILFQYSEGELIIQDIYIFNANEGSRVVSSGLNITINERSRVVSSGLNITIKDASNLYDSAVLKILDFMSERAEDRKVSYIINDYISSNMNKYLNGNIRRLIMTFYY